MEGELCSSELRSLELLHWYLGFVYFRFILLSSCFAMVVSEGVSGCFSGLGYALVRHFGKKSFVAIN